jgi:hypothetical protein
MATYYVDTDVVGGSADGSSWANAFSSLSSYITARGTVTLSEPEFVYCRGATVDSTEALFANITTSETNYLQIEVPSAYRHPGRYSTSHYRLEGSSIGAAMFAFGNPSSPNTITKNVRVIGVQAKNTNANSGSCAFFANFGTAPGTAVNLEQIDCIAGGTSTNTANHGFVGSNGRFRYINCIAVGCSGGGFVANYATIGNTTEWYNCAACNNGTDGFAPSSSSTTITARNCYAGGNGGLDFNQNNRFDTYSNLYSADDHSATATPATTVCAFSTSSGGYFTNVTPGSEDLRIGASSALKDAGYDLSGTFTTDILGNTRGATFDVGPFEYVASGGALLLLASNANDASGISDFFGG